MRPLKALKRTIALFLALGLVVAFANTYLDNDLFSSNFMEVETLSIVDNFDIEDDVRDVASAERELPAAQYLPANLSNRALINRKWEITRIINENQEVVFDIFNRIEDKNKLLELEFEMVGTSQVRIDGDENLIFDISLLHESGKTIVLFRSFGDGFEIIEARKREFKRSFNRLVKDTFTKEKTNKINSEKVIEKKKGLFFKHIGQSLLLERAIVPTINQGVFKQFQVEGELVLGENTLESMYARVGIGTANEFSFPSLDYVKVNDGGQFSFENDNGDIISGVITNNGKDGYRVRIATGPYAGTMLNFVTSEELDRIQDKERELRQKEEEIKAQNEQRQASKLPSFFGGNRPQRLPASN